MSEPPGEFLTLQDLRFVELEDASLARTELVSAYGENLLRAPGTEGFRAIYNVVGIAGTGKSFMLDRFEDEANDRKLPCGRTDHDQLDVVSIMRRLANGLSCSALFRDYLKADEQYREHVDQITRDSDTPPSVAESIGRAAGHGAVVLGPQVFPPLALPLAFVNEDTVVNASGEVASFLSGKLKKNSDEIRLITEPLQTLTPLFAAGLRQVVEKRGACTLLFDTFERTQPYVEPWLRKLVSSEYGRVPASVIVAIAGQISLTRTEWSVDDKYVEHIHLDVFTRDEALAFLQHRGITDPHVTSVILRLSGCLPVLLATLAAESPSRAEDVGDVTGTAMEVFLKWVADPARRAVAVAGAFPRSLNEDTLGVALKNADARTEFVWLRSLPFVQEKTDGWTYHEVARTQLLRHEHKESPSRWHDRHSALYEHFERERAALVARQSKELDQTSEIRRLQNEVVYHDCCADRDATSRLLRVVGKLIDGQRSIAGDIASAGLQAGEDSGNDSLERIGRVLVDASSKDDPVKAVSALDFLIASAAAEANPDLRAGWLHIRGYELAAMKKFSAALKDFDAALNDYPIKTHMHVDRARCLFALGDFPGGSAALDQAIEVCDSEADMANALSRRASVRLADDRILDALQDVERALKFSPKKGHLLLFRGEVKSRLGERSGAIGDFQHAMESDPALRHEALQQMGAQLLELGKGHDAERALIESLEEHPNCQHCWSVLVGLAVDGVASKTPADLRKLPLELSSSGVSMRATEFGLRGLNDLALADVEEALERRPDWMPDLGGDLGLWLSYAGRYDEAVNIMRETLAITPGHMSVSYNLAIALARLKGLDAAEVELVQARERALRSTEDAPYTVGYALAGIAAVTRNDSKALDYLATALSSAGRRRWAVRAWAQYDPAWIELRDDQRFRGLLNESDERG